MGDHARRYGGSVGFDARTEVCSYTLLQFIVATSHNLSSESYMGYLQCL